MCSIVEVDSFSDGGIVCWASENDNVSSSITDAEGETVTPSMLDLVWWRRLTGKARLPDAVTDPAAIDLIERSTRAAVLGVMLTDFSGRWISHPENTRLAENKLVQLRAAARVELPIPKTLVSQDHGVVRAFCEKRNYQVIVKVVAPTPETPLMTGKVEPEMLTRDAVRLSPCIYQELVPGTDHLRVCCFGATVITAMLESDRLDWRYPQPTSAQEYFLPETLQQKLKRLLRVLGIEMGIMDLKVNDSGDLVWLEVNPQGQFMFLEHLCRIQITHPFVQFLQEQALLGREHRIATG